VRERIRDFYDAAAARYFDERYLGATAEPRVALRRRAIVLDLCGDETGRVLDIGCGPAILTTDLLRRNFTVVNLDLAPKMLLHGRARLEDPQDARVAWVNGDIELLPFRPGSFDRVIAVGVLGLLESMTRLLSEINRALRPEGVVIIQFANAKSPTAYVNHCWQRLADALGLSSGLTRANFPPTRYHHRTVDRLLANAGFRIRRTASYDFRPPLVELLPVAAQISIAEVLHSVMSRWTMLSWLGEGCIVEAVKQKEL
jgi:ubiquinone/menaquinone biosynthesis C-methylase UbiE